MTKRQRCGLASLCVSGPILAGYWHAAAFDLKGVAVLLIVIIGQALVYRDK